MTKKPPKTNESQTLILPPTLSNKIKYCHQHFNQNTPPPNTHPQTMRRNYQGRGVLFEKREKLLGAAMQAGRDGATVRGRL
jgi:hypothetical protein